MDHRCTRKRCKPTRKIINLAEMIVYRVPDARNPRTGEPVYVRRPGRGNVD